jgi:hypothetical protein
VPQLPHYHINRSVSMGLLLVNIERVTTLRHVFFSGGYLILSFSRLAHDACCLFIIAISKTMLSLI